MQITSVVLIFSYDYNNGQYLVLSVSEDEFVPINIPWMLDASPDIKKVIGTQLNVNPNWLKPQVCDYFENTETEFRIFYTLSFPQFLIKDFQWMTTKTMPTNWRNLLTAHH